VQSIAVRDLGLREAADRAIFLAARSASAVVMTKDIDFVRLLAELGPPPQVIWLTCGNTSNARLKQTLTRALPGALSLLNSGQPVVEIR
jgi:predicted nuclease of predicted toxin-antitoxin system